MNILSNFGENLKELILDKNLTTKTFAEEIGIDRSVIYKYMRNETFPTLEHLIIICNYFECSADFILGLSPTNPLVKYYSAQPFSEQFKRELNNKKFTRYKFRKEILKKHISFSKQAVDDWFNGKRNPTVENIILIAKYFECTVDSLLGRE